MNTPSVSLQRWLRRGVIIALVIAAIVGMARLANHLGDPPQTQREAESHLDRPLIAYAVWDGVPHAVFVFGGSVHFDRLILDWVSVEWPPTPRWQWTGNWSTLGVTTDPASVGVSGALGEQVLYGQINARNIA